MGALTGKTALVTGGSRGIGRATAQRLADAGAVVAVHYGRNTEAAEEAVAAIRAAGGAAFALEAELGTKGDAEALWSEFDRLVVEYAAEPGLDILVNNAGIAPRGRIGETTAETFDEAIAVNARAPFFVTQQGLTRLRDGGRIISLSTGATRVALPDLIAYSMSKAAIDIFTHTLAKEVGDRGITVNAVAPGVTDTDMNSSWLRGNPEAQAFAAQQSALGRVGRPDDVAEVVAFLATDAARWITGQLIDATGGTNL